MAAANGWLLMHCWTHMPVARSHAPRRPAALPHGVLALCACGQPGASSPVCIRGVSAVPGTRAHTRRRRPAPAAPANARHGPAVAVRAGWRGVLGRFAVSGRRSAPCAGAGRLSRTWRGARCWLQRLAAGGCHRRAARSHFNTRVLAHGGIVQQQAIRGQPSRRGNFVRAYNGGKYCRSDALGPRIHAALCI